MPKTKKKPDKHDIWRLFEAAERHGNDSEPDHEVGDLQDVAEACWKVMFPDQKQRVFEELEEFLEHWNPEEED